MLLRKKDLLESPSSNSRIMLPIAYVNVLSNHFKFLLRKTRGKIHAYVCACLRAHNFSDNPPIFHGLE
jgi:hypothetical protein